jgi:hypothetical protein
MPFRSRSGEIAAVVGSLLLSSAGPCAADVVVDSFTITPNSIATGEAAQIALTLSFVLPDLGPFASVTDVTVLSESIRFTMGDDPIGGNTFDFNGLNGHLFVPGSSIVLTASNIFLHAGTFFPGFDYDFQIMETITGSGFSVPVTGENTGSGSAKIVVSDALVISDPGPMTPAVPEPSTWAMMVLGFAGIGAITYRRRKTVKA